MIPARGYATDGPSSLLKPFHFKREDVGENRQ